MKIKNKSLWKTLFLVPMLSCLSEAQVKNGNEESKIFKTITHENRGRKVTITHLTPDEVTAVVEEQRLLKTAQRQALKALENQRASISAQDSPVIQKSFVVAATVYDNSYSQLKLWPAEAGGGEPLVAYSNCNWHHFTGEQTFQDGNILYSFILLPVNASGDEKIQKSMRPKELSTLSQAGAKYMVIEGGEPEDQLNFLESIHARYDKDKKRLVRSYRDRKTAKRIREVQLRSNPPRPKDVTIRFGRLMKTATQPNNKQQKEK